jgi:hypothetical protein
VIAPSDPKRQILLISLYLPTKSLRTAGLKKYIISIWGFATTIRLRTAVLKKYIMQKKKKKTGDVLKIFIAEDY